MKHKIIAIIWVIFSGIFFLFRNHPFTGAEESPAGVGYKGVKINRGVVYWPYRGEKGFFYVYEKI